MWRWLRALAMGIGWFWVGVLSLLFLMTGLRWAQVSVFPSPLPTERLAEKNDYLAGLPSRAAASPPNVVVIFFDDLGWGDLSSYGNQLIRTPAIDQAAAEGLRMTDFYSASPVCTPSRAALLTGRFPVRSRTHTHVFFTESGPVATLRRMMGIGNELVRDEILLPEVLQKVGYATGMVGKWHLGGIPGHLPNDFGFDEYFGVLWSNDMQPLHLYRNEEIEVRDETPMTFGAAFRDEDSEVVMKGMDQRQLTRRYTGEAVQFIEKNREQPFFLYLAHSLPHVPHFADPEFAGSSEGGIYGDVVEDLDRSTGAVLEALARLGLEENTLVLITSDNGADYNGSPGPLRGRKGDVLEGGQRVPMIARWPGTIEPGRVSDAMGMNIDILPTVLSLVDVPLPQDRVIDGADLSAFLRGAAETPHEQLFYFPVTSAEPAAVRDDRFKYLQSTGDPGRDKPTLTDLRRDQEGHNLIRRFPEAGQRLGRALTQMTEQVRQNPRGWK